MSRSEQGIEVFEDERQPTEALAILDKVLAIAVVDQASLTVANGYLLEAKAWLRHCDDEFDKGISEAFAHHRTLVAQKKKWTAPALEVESVAKPKIASYFEEQDRLRREAERAAEQARLAAEKEAEDAADIATDLIKEGKNGEAGQIVDMAMENIERLRAAAPAVPPKPIAAGVSLRETWEFEVVNEALIPRKFLVPDLTMIRRYGQNMKHQAEIPGIRFYSKKSVASRIG
jgi:hypothetical protein